MCEILVMLRDRSTPDPERDRKGCVKTGMPVIVRDDGWGWGRMENKKVWTDEGNDPNAWPSEGNWGVLKIPGYPTQPLRELEHPQNVDDSGQGNGRQHFRIRAWTINPSLLPPAVVSEMLSTGEATINPGQLRVALRRIRDNAAFPGL